ncbi:hypothetical protein ABEB36_008377 [Hypothenemus hampei]|uniref:Ankyrin repeat and MYND domain-containing protein 1 n=1 Tax=Hypothenemus hampei TaxID=57062 RepID=A0ABD1ELN2_HYPHA
MKSKFSSEIIYFNASDDILKKEGSYYEPPNIKIVHKRDIPTDLPILASTSASSNVSEITNLVTQPKKEYKKINCGHDCYEGSILMDNLHGTGFYYTEQGGRKYFYDGMFYINKLEGYGQVFYDNGSHFQGLFKTHFRYGPGVLTHSDGTQDVGFWHGFKLIRLTCPVGGYTVPTLASTPAGKCKLLSYKYIVPIKEKTGITMKQALENIGTSKETFVQTDAVFNLNIRNPDSSFFHKLFYDEQFFGSEQGTIKVYVDKGIENCEPNYESKNDNKAILERIDNLKIKIHEVNETLQTLIVIRQNLESRCKKCQLCCQSEDSSSEENETTAKDLSKNDGTTNNLEEPFFDASANSLDIEILEDYNVSSEMPSLIQISKSCTCNEDEYKNGLRDLEEQLQNIQKQEMFYKSIRDELKKKLDKITQKELNKHQNLRYKLVEVNELWAWNNENSLIEIQKHCFKHQHSEDMVNFSVPNLILGNRKDFAPAGEHEQICQNFLLCCSKGRKEYVNECLKNNSVHPNMADSRGNTGIFFAAVKNRHEIISTLVNFGVKLDQFNDDQLTPLSMSLLRYIYLKNNCQSWERAFLPETKPRDLLFIPKWYKVKSFQSITSVTSKTSLCFEQSNSHQPCSNMKIVNLLQQLATNESEKGIALRTQYNSSFIFDMNCKNSPEKQKQDDYINNNLTVELEAIQSTIMTLLYYGTNPNVCETPYPPLILTLFTGNPDLVKAVIEANAQISVQIEDGLSCLHVAASLPPKVENANIYTVLTKYGCSPKARTSPTHWQDRKLTFTGKIPETFDLKDEGKTPLHLLCMRTDYERKEGEHYFCTIAKTILNININIEETYLGHTPLSLAMLSGNIALVKCFLKTNIYDPHKPLQYGMGNILTLYALKRFDKILPLAKCKEILTVLMNANMNVLNKVYESENAIVFTEDRDNYFDQFTDKTQKIDNNSKRRKEEKNTQNHAIKEFLKSIGRQIIIKQVQLTITDIIFLFIEEDMLEDSEISIILSTVYLTPQIAIENLKGLFEYGKIEHDRLDPKNIRKFFEFVSIHNKLMKKDKRSKEIKKEKRKDKEPKEEKKNTLETMVKEFDVALNLHYAPPKFLIPPGTHLCK